MGPMKLIPLLFCATVLVATPLASQAGGHTGGLRASLGMGMGAGFFMGPQDDRGRNRHGDAPGRGGAPNPGSARRGDDRRDPRDARDYGGGPPPPPVYRGNAGVYGHRPLIMGGGSGVPRDNRINRAFAIGQGYGHVVNAWPQGGSLYLVRVNTPHGRVDMVIDVDTGRVVGER